MNKLLLPLLGILFASTIQAESVGWEVSEQDQTYKYQCNYSTEEDQNGNRTLVVVWGEVDSLAELKGKQEVVVEADGKVKTIKVGNCTVEM